MKMVSSVLSLYGNVAIPKAFCRKCNTNAFVIDGEFACCGSSTTDTPKQIKREIEPEQRRRRPSVSRRKQILEEQDNRCIYCEQRFGSVRFRGSKMIHLKIHWDHSFPFAATQNNSDGNFVAACHVCNAIKHSSIYRDLADARIHLADARKQKGYDF